MALMEKFYDTIKSKKNYSTNYNVKNKKQNSITIQNVINFSKKNYFNLKLKN